MIILKKTFIIILLNLISWAMLEVAVAGDSDHIEARELSLRKEILPLNDILKRINPSQLGTVLNIELENEQHHIIYDIELLDKENRFIEIHIDAKTGAILKKKSTE